MLQSMTGFGKAELNSKNANFTIEVKSLNSKQIDVIVKMPSIYRDKEIDLRKSISEKLQRGKIEVSIWREKSESSSNYTLNKNVIKEYHKQIEDLRKELGYKDPLEGFEVETFRDVMLTMVQMPEFLIRGEKTDETDWEKILEATHKAIDNLIQFRKDEGKILEKDLNIRINILSQLLKDIDPLSKNRIEKIKNNLNNKLSDLDEKNIDLNRFEQELIYYLEKQDITEEQVRLNTHLNYFLEVMNMNSSNGKKLGFIIQEIGREINTIGSKSSDAEMQKIVVQMKDELEKIKEQLLNIL
tara:strand:+ start:12481 stop:13377 length:897 start_codon:yes stop_codon:yes gene_type:complete